MKNEIMKSIEELSEKANKYENMRQRYVEHARKIKEAVDILNDVMKEIDPFMTVHTRTGCNINYSEMIAELKDKMINGTVIDAELINNTYNLGERKSWYLLRKLSTEKNVIKRNAGKKIELVANKEY